MISVSQLLEHLSTEEILEVKKVEKILKLTKKSEKEKLSIAIKALTKLGLIQELPQGIKKVIDPTFIEARLRCSSKGYCFAVRNDGDDDIYIRDQHLNCAWNGDRVLVKISREAIKRRSPEGKIQCILQRSTDHLLGSLDTNKDKSCLNPLDDRILNSIHLPDIEDKFIKENNGHNLFEVQINKYPIAQYPATGTIVRSLPIDGGKESDKDLLITKHNLNSRDIPPRSIIKKVSDKDRIDLTSQKALMFSSWQSGTSPILPAIFAETRAGGARIWLHSPSVAERVSYGSSLERWIKDRTESICLGDTWLNLLGKSLTDASRFQVGVDNQAISICMDITSEGELIDWTFALTKIKPVAEITSEHLEIISRRKTKTRIIPSRLKPIKDYIDQTQTIIYIANQIRLYNQTKGLIELDISPPLLETLGDLNYQYPTNRWQQWVLPIDNKDPNSVLNPILRNAEIAWYLHTRNTKLPSWIIESEQADKSTLNEVAKASLALDVKLELDDQGVTSASELSTAFKKTESRNILDKLLKHSLPSPKINRSLLLKKDNNINENVYAPWTCPSLHYHDIANQYVISSLLKEGKKKSTSRSKNIINLGQKDCWKDIDWDILPEESLKELVKMFTEQTTSQLNTQNRRARSLYNGFISMLQARNIEKSIGKELDAVVSGVQSYGFFAEILPTMAEGLVHVSTLNDDWYEYRSRQCRLVGRKNKKSYQLGDKVSVKILKIDILRNQIDLEINQDANKSTTSIVKEIADIDKEENSTLPE